MPELAYLLPKVILASQSVARKALLEELGIEVVVHPTNCDETHELNNPSEVVAMLALRKLQAYQKEHPAYMLPVLCCDTLISFEGKLIGKPENRAEAKSQLLAFNAKLQEVHSGWALWYKQSIVTGVDRALVYFRHLDDQAIEKYLDTLEYKGAAGSYRIQGAGQSLVDHIEGDKGTVIGLPVNQLSRTLAGTYQQYQHSWNIAGS